MILYGGCLVETNIGDCIESMRKMPEQSVQCCVTSPPYFGLRDYGHEGQIGLEQTPDTYVAKMVEVFREAWRVLRDDGVLWLNLGDSYVSQGGLHDGRTDNQAGVGAKRVWREGSGRADGVVDNRGQRNRNGLTVPGIAPKNLIGIPWRVAFALQADGWYLRQDIIWHKPNPMPESVTDRCTKAHEYIFMLTKNARYYYDAAAIKEPAKYIDKSNGKTIYKSAAAYDGKHSDKQRGHGRRHAGFNDRWDAMTKEEQQATGANKRDVWTVATKPFKGSHFATFPPDLIEPCILAGSKPGDIVLDPFGGSGTVAGVSVKHGRNAILCELNPEYAALVPARIQQITGGTDA